LPLPLILARRLGVSESARILIALGGSLLFSKVCSMATEHYSSPAPIKFGPYAVTFTVRPAKGTKPATKRPLTDDFLREELADRLREGDLMFDFVVQFYVNEQSTPIEDTSVPWKREHAPFVTVARLRIPKCDMTDPRTAALSEAVDRLSFNPWHATEDHRPLGNVMRARKGRLSGELGFPASRSRTDQFASQRRGLRHFINYSRSLLRPMPQPRSASAALGSALPFRASSRH
jgi:hypothetical protein